MKIFSIIISFGYIFYHANAQSDEVDVLKLGADGENEICLDFSNLESDEHTFCSDVFPENDSTSTNSVSTIMSLSSQSLKFPIKLGINNSKLMIELNGTIFTSVTPILNGIWTRICYTYNVFNDQPKLYVNDILTDINEIFEFETLMTSVADDENNENKLCFGDEELQQNLFLHNVFLTEENLDIKYLKSTSICYEFSSNEFVLSWMKIKEAFNLSNITEKRTAADICRSQKVPVIIKEPLTHSEFKIKCENIGGDVILENQLPIFYTQIMNLDVTCPNFTSWIEFNDNTPQNEYNLRKKCPVIKGDVEVNDTFCITTLECNVCLLSNLMPIRLYGILKKYDRLYTIRQDENYNLVFLGNDTSYISYEERNIWTLRSIVHTETWTLENISIPIGRNQWKRSNSSQMALLALSQCAHKYMACDNGECVEIAHRCDGNLDCFDFSDEKDCETLIKEPGYDKNISPEANNDTLVIESWIQIYSIKDISTKEGIAEIDMQIELYWNDPRFYMKNVYDDMDIDCNELWMPAIGGMDGYPKGHVTILNIHHNECSVENLENVHIFDELDPYMGTYTPGQKLNIKHQLEIILKLPCRFELHTFPFGKQNCKFNFWLDNVKYYSLNAMTSKIKFLGSADLGEYSFVSSLSESPDENSFSITVVINLKSNYAFHLLNSFTPSLLIILISYMTLLFPVKDFNERIMVSLTALLVLAALFAQSSDYSVVTSYIKFIDLWFVGLIGISFIMIGFNTVIRSILENDENNDVHRIGTKESIKICRKVDPIVTAKKVNQIAKIICAVLILFFVMFFVYSASISEFD